jgi:hypothetical protein
MAQSKFIELLEGLENGYHFNHYLGEENKINIFSFTPYSDVTNFAGYFNQHIAPVLRKILNGEELNQKENTILHFLASDLLNLFADDED